MNEIVNKFSLDGLKFMPKIHLRQPVLLDYLLKTKKEYKSLKKQRIYDIFTK